MLPESIMFGVVVGVISTLVLMVLLSIVKDERALAAEKEKARWAEVAALQGRVTQLELDLTKVENDRTTRPTKQRLARTSKRRA